MDLVVSSIILLSDTRLTVVTPAAGCVATVLIIFCYTNMLIAFPERPVKRGGFSPVHRLGSEDLIVLYSDLFDITRIRVA